MMQRREFITLLGGAVAWPLSARAQQGGRMRRIGVLLAFDENDPVVKTRLSAFTRALAGLGWTDGRNVRVDVRWSGGLTGQMRLNIDVIRSRLRKAGKQISVLLQK
jgi:hypothetical protein